MFNFEGGCYAKVIRLRPETEPEIYNATRTFGTVLENVVLDPATRSVDYDSDRSPKTPAPAIRSTTSATISPAASAAIR